MSSRAGGSGAERIRAALTELDGMHNRMLRSMVLDLEAEARLAAGDLPPGGPAGAGRSTPRGQRDRRGGVRRSAGRLGRTARLAGRRKQSLHLVQALLLAQLRLRASLLLGVTELRHGDPAPPAGQRLEVDDVWYLCRHAGRDAGGRRVDRIAVGVGERADELDPARLGETV